MYLYLLPPLQQQYYCGGRQPSQLCKHIFSSIHQSIKEIFQEHSRKSKCIVLSVTGQLQNMYLKQNKHSESVNEGRLLFLQIAKKKVI